MSIELAEYRDLFFCGAHEELESISAAIRKLDRDPGDVVAFQHALRAAHTLKGMAATMGYDEITVIAHAFEDLLESACDRSKGASDVGIPPLFRTLDHLKNIIARQESTLSHSGGTPESGEACLIRVPLENESPPIVRVSSEQLERLTAGILEFIGSGYQLAYAEAPELSGGRNADWYTHLALAKRLLATAWSLQMAPIGQVFDRFPPMLHDQAREARKDVRVKLEGTEVEIARASLEEVAEVLLHLVRNAIVHGVEPVTERLAAGKDPCATITLRAWEHGDLVSIEVSDDGRGLDPGRILRAAHEQDIISQDQLDSMGQADAYNMIMLPGFSLSPAVTKASGRGVGMDIVCKQVQSLHGRTHISSTPGAGTTFTLEFCRTNGATEVELVRVDERILALPAAQIESKQALTECDLTVQGPDQVCVAGRLLRLIDVRSSLELPPRLASSPCGFLVTSRGAAVAARVDEFLGKTLWRKPVDGSTPPVPLIDLDRLATV